MTYCICFVFSSDLTEVLLEQWDYGDFLGERLNGISLAIKDDSPRDTAVKDVAEWLNLTVTPEELVLVNVVTEDRGTVFYSHYNYALRVNKDRIPEEILQSKNLKWCKIEEALGGVTNKFLKGIHTIECIEKAIDLLASN